MLDQEGSLPLFHWYVDAGLVINDLAHSLVGAPDLDWLGIVSSLTTRSGRAGGSGSLEGSLSVPSSDSAVADRGFFGSGFGFGGFLGLGSSASGWRPCSS